MRTITAASDVERLFTQGSRTSAGPLSIVATPSPAYAGGEGRVIFVAGRKLGGAVVRNRSKRVLREACRRAGGPWAGHDVALIGRGGAATSTPAELDAALASCLRRAGLRSGA